MGMLLPGPIASALLASLVAAMDEQQESTIMARVEKRILDVCCAP